MYYALAVKNGLFHERLSTLTLFEEYIRHMNSCRWTNSSTDTSHSTPSWWNNSWYTGRHFTNFNAVRSSFPENVLTLSHPVKACRPGRQIQQWRSKTFVTLINLVRIFVLHFQYIVANWTKCQANYKYIGIFWWYNNSLEIIPCCMRCVKKKSGVCFPLSWRQISSFFGRGEKVFLC